MTNTEKLAALKIDLGLTTEAYDTRLLSYLDASAQELALEGVTLSDESLADCNLQIMYAAWMWRRRDSGEGIPRMIRWQINNRLFDMKTAGE